MSGLDPLAALAAEAAVAAQTAIQSSIDLGAAVALQAQIQVGEVIAATVLPPEGGNDRLALLGQIVNAQLPAGIFPGETLQLRVTGFQGNQILVQNVATEGDASQASGVPQRAVLTTTSPTAAPAAPTGTNLAPPRELFVAASVLPHDVEARIALTRATGEALPPQRLLVEPPAPPSSPASAPPAPSASPGPAASSASPAPVALRPDAATPSPPAPASLSQPLRNVTVEAAARNAVAGTPAAPAPSARVLAESPEQRLLARLQIPFSPNALAAARLVRDALQTLPRAYERLDAVLARIVGGASDPRVGTARALLAFNGRIDLGNTRALPEQIASFVSNVVDGTESKLASIVRALGTAQSSAPTPASAVTEETTRANDVPPSVAARVAERLVALSSDVKAALSSLVESPPAGASPQIAQALSDALTSTTAVQLQTLNAQVNDPHTIAIALPATFHPGGRPVELRIARETRDGKKKLDADTFHVAFVLDTASLGTVAIDLHSVGRGVSVAVKTENVSAADRFRATFDDIRSRLTELRYRVASVSAGVAPRGAAEPAPASDHLADVTPEAAPHSTLDVRA